MAGLRNRIRAWARDRRGNVGVEFAVALPFLILLFAALIDLGRAMYDDMSLTAAARSAAQYARANPADAAGVRAAAMAAGNVPADARVATSTFCECPGGAAVVCTNTCAGSVAPLVFVRVRVDRVFTPLLPYPGIPESLPLSGDAILRVQ